MFSKEYGNAMQVSVYRYNPESGEETAHAGHVGGPAGGPGPHGARCAGAPEGTGPDPVLPPQLPGRRLRFRRHQHERQERPGLHHAGVRGGAGRQTGAAAAAGPARRPGPGGGHDPVLPPVREDQALSHQRYAPAGPGTPADPGGARGTRRPVRVHTVRLLFHRVPVVLVESRQVRRPPPGCCSPTASWRTAATRPPKSAWRISRTRSASFAAGAS